ncbi:hypothetical protein [Catellatospora sichuanensis]|uniref:hypothetical protein n=1 Tax=Catellatospora sichuanensis TaxID=1969805 RepID=UPI00118373C8|nr:hypothetical protein [Catellatospora sichuanensis]
MSVLSMRSLRDRWSGHVCLAALPVATVEHLIAIDRQASAAGMTTCYLTFGNSNFDLDARAIEGIAKATVVQDAEQLRRHVADSRSAAVFLQSPYPEHYPAWFFDCADSFSLAYAGYGLPLSTWTHGHFRTDPILASSYLLAAGKYELDGYAANSPNADVLLSGNPLLWELRDRLSHAGPARDDGAKLLWAPHWTKTLWDGSRGYSRWQESAGAMLDWKKSRPSDHLVFRPHPIFKMALESYLDGATSVAHREAAKSIDMATDGWAVEVIRELLALPNVEVSTSSMVDDILRCDALVTDGISIIAYWSATGKPLVVIRDSASPRFNDDGEALVSVAEVAANGSEISEWLQKWSAGAVTASPGRAEASRRIHPTLASSPVDIWKAALPADTIVSRARRCWQPTRTPAQARH